MDGWSLGARVCVLKPRYPIPAHRPDQSTDMQGSSANSDALLHGKKSKNQTKGLGCKPGDHGAF